MTPKLDLSPFADALRNLENDPSFAHAQKRHFLARAAGLMTNGRSSIADEVLLDFASRNWGNPHIESVNAIRSSMNERVRQYYEAACTKDKSPVG
ncbi:MAG: hypothetical protein WCS85_00520 [Candidatus Peribacteraceae bacterium]|jgi:hypothetical protein